MNLSTMMEQFSNSFLYAIASAAGCSLAKPSVDNDSVDWTLSKRLSRRPKLDVQLKSTATLEIGNGTLSYPLKKKNYDDLRILELTVPRILVVVLMPPKVDDWLESRPEELILRKCALWIALAGSADSSNESSVTVRIPASQCFDVQSLRGLMESVNDGRPLS